MTKRILAFGASNSTTSINKALVTYAANQVPNAEVDLIDLNDFEMPIYSLDREKESGIHPLAIAFKNRIKEADGLVISFAEYNGAYSSAFKNIFDWISRIERNTWDNKPAFLLATSPGGRGGKSVLAAATARFEHSNDNITVSFSLPSFNQNFSREEGITNPELKAAFDEQVQKFAEAL